MKQFRQRNHQVMGSHSLSVGGCLWGPQREFALSTNAWMQPGGALCFLLVAVLIYLVHSTIEGPKQANYCRLGVEVCSKGAWKRGVRACHER